MPKYEWQQSYELNFPIDPPAALCWIRSLGPLKRSDGIFIFSAGAEMSALETTSHETAVSLYYQALMHEITQKDL